MLPNQVTGRLPITSGTEDALSWTAWLTWPLRVKACIFIRLKLCAGLVSPRPPVTDPRGRFEDLSLSVLVGGPTRAWQHGGVTSSRRRPSVADGASPDVSSLCSPATAAGLQPAGRGAEALAPPRRRFKALLGGGDEMSRGYGDVRFKSSPVDRGRAIQSQKVCVKNWCRH